LPNYATPAKSNCLLAAKRLKKLTNNYTDIHKTLIERSKQGDAKAQYELYNNYSKAMYNICYRMMNNQQEAEDMLQEAFTECFLKLNSFRYESSFGAWLKRIVINKCINHLKKRKVNLLLADNLEIYQKNNPISTDMYDENSRNFEVKQILDAMNKLSDGYRIIFSLYLIEGYDHGEIADILSISESTSKSQYMRAKRRIKELILSNNHEGQIRTIYN